MAYCGALVRPLTASVEAGQSSPSLSTGGGCTAAVGVSAGWAVFSAAGGCPRVLDLGVVPGAPCPAWVGFLALEVLAPALPLTTATMIATTMAITTTATPIANPR